MGRPLSNNALSSLIGVSPVTLSHGSLPQGDGGTAPPCDPRARLRNGAGPGKARRRRRSLMASSGAGPAAGPTPGPVLGLDHATLVVEALDGAVAAYEML